MTEGVIPVLQVINEVMKEEIAERRQAVEDLLNSQKSLQNRNPRLELEELTAYLACAGEQAESASFIRR